MLSWQVCKCGFSSQPSWQPICNLPQSCFCTSVPASGADPHSQASGSTESTSLATLDSGRPQVVNFAVCTCLAGCRLPAWLIHLQSFCCLTADADSQLWKHCLDSLCPQTYVSKFKNSIGSTAHLTKEIHLSRPAYYLSKALCQKTAGGVAADFSRSGLAGMYCSV